MKYVNALGGVLPKEIRNIYVNTKIVDIYYCSGIKSDYKYVVIFEDGTASSFTKDGKNESGEQQFVYRNKQSVKSMKKIFEEFSNSFFSENGDLNIVDKKDNTMGVLTPNMFHLLDTNDLDPRIHPFLVKEVE